MLNTLLRTISPITQTPRTKIIFWEMKPNILLLYQHEEELPLIYNPVD